MNYVLVPIAHGVEFEVIKAGFAAPFIEGIAKHLTEPERNYFIPLPYNYTRRTNERQLQMFNAVEKGLGNQELRRLKHTVGSDVTWSFIVAKAGADCFSKDFCSDVTLLIDNARAKYPSAKVVCVGHSQGTQNFFEFFFEYARKIDLFVSMGSPISMNSGAWTDWGRVPANLGAWVNFYHALDFVSSKLQGCHPSAGIASFVEDHEVPAGCNPLFWLPKFKFPRVRLWAALEAHVAYWKKDFVHKIVAAKIKALINS